MGHIAALTGGILLGLFTISTIVLKLITFGRAKDTSRAFAPEIAKAFQDKQIEEALKLAEQYSAKSHMAKIVAVGLREFQTEQAAGASIETCIRRAEREMNRVRE